MHMPLLNKTTYQYSLPEVFKEVCLEFPRNIALQYDNDSYSYQQLDKDSSLIASILINLELKRGDVVLIFNAKEYVSYALMLACLKLGVIYTNVDPNIPPTWLSHIIDTCKPKKIFSESTLRPNLFEQARLNEKHIFSISNLIKENSRFFNTSPYLDLIDGSAIAYIMFTSGSTGHPKGVAVTHQNLIHFICWSQIRFNIQNHDILTNVNPMYFDNSVFDFYSAIFSGATLAPIKKEIVDNPKNLIEYVDKLKCTIWFSVPSLLMYLMTTRVLNKTTLKSLRIICFGGEGYPKVELKKLFDIYSKQATFINVYGPTECTCICSSYQISTSDFENLDGLPPLGKMNANISHLILNEDSKPDTRGELCLIGPNVAVGYFNDPEKTKKSFKDLNSFGHYGAKMYKTGDIVYEENNLLYFSGRKDNQIKHLGYRIELETIELALKKIEAINEVAVIYNRVNQIFGKIIAFITAINFKLESSDIKDALKQHLPAYMIPNKFIFLDVLPKNANGKTNKVKLNSYFKSKERVPYAK